MKENKHFLALANGEIFYGISRGAPVDRLGEVVFNTGMTGYQEIVTDPSYFGQIVALTASEIGNYGVNFQDRESDALHLSGLLVRELNPSSNWRSEEDLSDLLKRFEKPLLSDLDIRHLVLHLRKTGTQRAFIHCSDQEICPEEAVQKARSWSGLDGIDSVSEVTCSQAYFWREETATKKIENKKTESEESELICSSRNSGEIIDGKIDETSRESAEENVDTSAPLIVAYDFGIKFGIVRRLAKIGLRVKIVPAKMSAKDVLAMKPAGVFLSNGPGDPSGVPGAIENVRDLIGKVPLMGICLGHQIIALASGAKTERLLFGHHGCNHPVKNLLDNTIVITSQNHNFTVNPDSFPATLELTHLNLNDKTVEGLRHRTEPIIAVQFHPEAAPGPYDSWNLFDQFKMML